MRDRSLARLGHGGFRHGSLDRVGLAHALDGGGRAVVEVLGELRVLLHRRMVEDGRVLTEAERQFDACKYLVDLLVREEQVTRRADALENSPSKASFGCDPGQLSGDGAGRRKRSECEHACYQSKDL